MRMPRDAMDQDAEGADDALVARFADGDAAAARLLTQRLVPRAYAHAVRLLGNHAEAEDIAQEAMLRLWRTAPRWRPGEARVTTWLYRVVANLCTDRLRRAGRDSFDLDAVPEPPGGAPGAEEALQSADRAAALQAALARLPLRQRQALVLRHIEGLANPRIAEIMETSTEAVESLTARGRRALAAELEGRRADLGYDA
ncbi:RNA polymerase sigma factor [Roseovarius salinarum]|jgi:RNA polymerase sigma-70 factor (ECF subfamily)|uniref:RNA polymerase sigma factor n=1 Tax=Roseovarius salinarum TaxID=1981892 RepID=UPI000C342474|nr:RNA polymerase sigma factor [Roseovarius salinarum]